MFPAFRTGAAALGAVAVNTALLLLPVALKHVDLGSRRGQWASIPVSQGPIGKMVETIYDEKEDADVLFVGTSNLLADVMPEEIEAALTHKLGRPARVRTLALFGPGVDMQYCLLRDYLERHTPRLVVFNAPIAHPSTNEPHRLMSRWLRYGQYEDAFSGLPLGPRVQVYGSMVLGGPRQLLRAVRPDEVGAQEKTPAMMEATLHKLRYRSYGGHVFAPQPLPVPEPFDGYLRADSPGVRVEGEVGFYTGHFLRKAVEIAARKQVPLAFLHLTNLEEFGRDDLPEIVDFAHEFGPGTRLIGVPFAKLLPRVNRDHANDFFFDLHHFNLNGAQVFSRAITPSVLAAYDAARSKP